MLVIAIILLLFLFFHFSVTCEKEKKLKLIQLQATRQDLGDAEQNVMECENAVKVIDAEIAKLRDIVIEKKKNELTTCKAKFDNKINTYKRVYKAAHGTEANESHINDLKNSLGIRNL
jgi:predicted RNase H-like nuclease (RuvC/YqgF family)